MKKIWDFIKRKKWWFILGLVVLLVVLVSGGKKTEEYVVETVVRGDIQETILATGQVVSETDLTLSFSQSGIVNSIPVSVGDVVGRGQILVSLQNSSELAGLTQAQAALNRARASLSQIVDGATSEEIEISRVALRNAEIDLLQSEIQQDRLVENAHRALLSDNIEAIPTTTTSETPPTISGTYLGDMEGIYNIRTYASGGGKRFSVEGLEVSDGLVDDTRPVEIGTLGLFIQFSSENTTNQRWSVSVPNTRGASYVTNLNAYDASQETRDITIAIKQSAVDTAQANLDNLVAAATSTEILLAEADILAAQGQVNAALAQVEDTRIRAPKSGTITRLDADLGGLIQAYEDAVVLQNVEQLLLEANINEANINKVYPGMPIEVTFDALSFDENYMAEVASVDIASTLVSGVVNYRITATLVDDTIEIRPGMTANMTLIVDERKDVLSVSGRAVIEKEDGDYVMFYEDGDTEEIEVVVGFQGDGSAVEVLEGLEEGDEVVINP